MEFHESPVTPADIRRSPRLAGGMDLWTSPLSPNRAGRALDVTPCRLQFVTASTSRRHQTPASSAASRSQSSHKRNELTSKKDKDFMGTQRAEANMSAADDSFRECRNGCGTDKVQGDAVTKGATIRHVKAIRKDCLKRINKGWSLLVEKKSYYFGALRHAEINRDGDPVRSNITVPTITPPERIGLCVEKCLATLLDVSDAFCDLGGIWVRHGCEHGRENGYDMGLTWV
jgi:hypothetical protein